MEFLGDTKNVCVCVLLINNRRMQERDVPLENIRHFILFTLTFIWWEKNILFVNIHLMEQVMTDRFNAPIVYSHNDLLSGNLMINDDEGSLPCIVFPLN